MAPCLPAGWSGFRAAYRFRTASYALQVTVGDTAGIVLDGTRHDGARVPLHDDGRAHEVQLTVPVRAPPA